MLVDVQETALGPTSNVKAPKPKQLALLTSALFLQSPCPALTQQMWRLGYADRTRPKESKPIICLYAMQGQNQSRKENCSLIKARPSHLMQELVCASTSCHLHAAGWQAPLHEDRPSRQTTLKSSNTYRRNMCSAWSRHTQGWRIFRPTWPLLST